MPPKKSGRRGSRGRGGRGPAAGSSSQGGGSSSPPLPPVDEVDEMEIVDINPYRPAENRRVEVAYVEEHLVREELVPEGRIREGWLQRCAKDSVNVWGQHLPGVEAQELTARQIPASARFYDDLAPGKGIVIVELLEGEKGLVNQISTLKGSEVQSADLLASMRTEMREGIAEMMQKNAEMKVKIEEKDAVHEARVEALEDQLRVQVEECNRRHEELHRRHEELHRRHEELKGLLRRGIELGDKVKKRVALTEARKTAEVACGRTKGERESWRSFFATYSEEDWARIGIQTSRVKEILAEGASELNDSIHSIPAVEVVVGAIGCMPLGALRSAWEEIFRLAFNRNVSDEIFHDEVDYAQNQQRVLLG